MTDAKNDFVPFELSRRSLLASSVAALAASGCAASGTTAPVPPRGAARAALAPSAPFDSLRDWIKALDAHGLLLKLDRIDQDKYQLPGLFFRATDRFSMYGTPAILFDEVKIDGEWVKGPLLINAQGHWNTDALIVGQQPVIGDHYETYRRARAYWKDMLVENGGRYPEISPVEIDRDRAPVKEVVLTGDDIDLTRFAFVKTNPADGGRYVNTGSVFMSDPEMGGNYGTYRCQLKGPRQLGLNPEPNQTGHKMLLAAKKRGEKSVPVSIVLGQDPIVWMISGTRVAPRFGPKPVDELAVAGGMRGKALEVVRSETNDMLVPAHAEMVIEGEVPLDAEMLPEGPFGEMFGYLGPYKEKNFWLNVTKVTHRRDPIIMNAMTGMQRGMVTAPSDALYSVQLKKIVPNFVEYTNPQDTMGFVVMSIDKQKAGEGREAGLAIAKRNPIAKVVVVVDKDINILDRREVVFAIGSRWQPHPASVILEDVFGLMTDPSQAVDTRTSKIVIDATRQLPDEGGPAVFPQTNRALLAKNAPEVFAEVDALFGGSLSDWERI